MRPQHNLPAPGRRAAARRRLRLRPRLRLHLRLACPNYRIQIEYSVNFFSWGQLISVQHDQADIERFTANAMRFAARLRTTAKMLDSAG